jgi:hypothetical protein
MPPHAAWKFDFCRQIKAGHTFLGLFRSKQINKLADDWKARCRLLRLPLLVHHGVFLFRKSSICFGTSYNTSMRKERNSTTSFASFSFVPVDPGCG